jgi:hypothetical protein
MKIITSEIKITKPRLKFFRRRFSAKFILIAKGISSQQDFRTLHQLIDKAELIIKAEKYR